MTRISLASRLLLAIGCLTQHAVATAQATQVMPLSGMGIAGETPVYWDFKLDSGRGSGKWARIVVPSCWEQQGFGAYYYGTQGRHVPDEDPVIPHEIGTYRREFEIPQSWAGREIIIVFEAVMTDASVLVNGHSAGPPHQGGFYRFSYDLTKLVRVGPNTIEVRVAKESANKSVNVAERRGDFWTFGGIFRPVWLESRPIDNLDWAAIDARADGSFYARVHLNRAASDRLSVRVHVADASQKTIASFDGHFVQDDTAVIVGRVDSPSPWTAETPRLYSATFQLLDGGQATHELHQRFGFRTLEVRPRDGIYLNGQKIVLKGINRHSFRPETGRTLTREQNFDDVRLIKSANMNAVRMSHYPPDPAFLEAADELGLYVLDELAGWQGSYDTPTGARLIGEVVRRDVNHPSILFWDNGNEGGWNRENDGEFDRWDPQRRPVLHPWGIFSGINTDHYENYESTTRLSKGPDIFMPTEFLHGLYDGGIGAGLQDYWDVMGASPTVAGGFFWAFADEGIARSDRSGEIDNVGNSAPDGFLGPGHEKEGSFYAVKEIWSPLQISDLTLDQGVLSMRVKNAYNFSNLDSGSASWRVVRLPRAGKSAEPVPIAQGKVAGPHVGPGESRVWKFPVGVRELHWGEFLELTFLDSRGQDLWTWTLKSTSPVSPHDSGRAPTISAHEGVVRAGNLTLEFDLTTGTITKIRTRGREIPLRGPEVTAWLRTPAKRSFDAIAGQSVLRKLDLAPKDEPGTLARLTYDGLLSDVVWRVDADKLVMRYSVRYTGDVDILGVRFNFPKERVQGKRWVGSGPYRVWKNRLAGTTWGLHQTPYSLSTPGKTFFYPEFEGFFGAWEWLEMQTSRGRIVVENDSGIPFFGLYQPAAGDKPIIELPDSGLSFLHAIPPIGTKFDLAETLGPQSQRTRIDGAVMGEISFSFP